MLDALASIDPSALLAAALGPTLIFLARVVDVSLQTFRILLIGRGLKLRAAVIGFVESLIWLAAISQVIQHLDRPAQFLAYAGGFAAGTWLGVYLEGRIALGLVAVRVITSEDARDLIDALAAEHFGVTNLAARGIQGKVRLIFTVLQRKQIERFLEIVRETHPKAFVSVSDVRSASEGYLASPRFERRGLLGLFGMRK